MEGQTIDKVERDVNAFLRGRKDGDVSIENESDTTVKGDRTVFGDIVSKTKHGGMRVAERDSTE